MAQAGAMAGRGRRPRGGLRAARRGDGRRARRRGPAPRHDPHHQLHDDLLLQPGRPGAPGGPVDPRRRRLRPPLRLPARLHGLPPALRERPPGHRPLGRGRGPARGRDPELPPRRARPVRRGAGQAGRAAPRPGAGGGGRRPAGRLRGPPHLGPRDGRRAPGPRRAGAGGGRSSGGGCARSATAPSRAPRWWSCWPRPRRPSARAAPPGRARAAWARRERPPAAR